MFTKKQEINEPLAEESALALNSGGLVWGVVGVTSILDSSCLSELLLSSCSGVLCPSDVWQLDTGEPWELDFSLGRRLRSSLTKVGLITFSGSEGKGKVSTCLEMISCCL